MSQNPAVQPILRTIEHVDPFQLDGALSSHFTCRCRVRQVEATVLVDASVQTL
jgi:hypothetical protein